MNILKGRFIFLHCYEMASVLNRSHFCRFQMSRYPSLGKNKKSQNCIMKYIIYGRRYLLKMTFFDVMK